MTLCTLEPMHRGKAVFQGHGSGVRLSREWRLSFDWEGVESSAASLVTTLHIAAEPSAVLCVQVYQRGLLKYQIDSSSDGRSGRIAAGVQVAAIAQMNGWPGMTIDLAGLGLQAGTTIVWLQVDAASARVAEQVQVTLGLRAGSGPI